MEFFFTIFTIPLEQPPAYLMKSPYSEKQGSTRRLRNFEGLCSRSCGRRSSRVLWLSLAQDIRLFAIAFLAAWGSRRPFPPSRQRDPGFWISSGRPAFEKNCLSMIAHHLPFGTNGLTGVGERAESLFLPSQFPSKEANPHADLPMPRGVYKTRGVYFGPSYSFLFFLSSSSLLATVLFV